MVVSTAGGNTVYLPNDAFAGFVHTRPFVSVYKIDSHPQGMCTHLNYIDYIDTQIADCNIYCSMPGLVPMTP